MLGISEQTVVQPLERVAGWVAALRTRSRPCDLRRCMLARLNARLRAWGLGTLGVRRSPVRHAEALGLLGGVDPTNPRASAAGSMQRPGPPGPYAPPSGPALAPRPRRKVQSPSGSVPIHPLVPSADRRGRLTTSVPDGRRFEREPAKHAVRASQESTWRLSCVRTQKPSIAGVVAWADVLVPLHEHPAPQSTASGSPCMSIHRPARRRLQVSGSPTPSRAEGAGASPRWRRGNSCLPERRANER